MNRLAAEDLQSIDSKAAPFVVSLQSGRAGVTVEFQCHQVLRALPGRRLVIHAAEDGQSVILKLFLGGGRRRYLKREEQGLVWLRQAGVPSAGLRDRVHGPEVDGLVLDYLPAAVAVSAGEQQHLEEIARLLGRMHENGIRHRDLHLDNFVVNASGIHAIDGDGVRGGHGTVSLSGGLDELAVLAAQRPPSEDGAAPEVLAAYDGERGMGTPVASDFDSRLRKARHARLQRYAGKTQRNCTEYAVEGSLRSRSFSVRGLGEDLLPLLADEAELFSRGEMLKSGNSATVVRVDGPTRCVVKRFNIKSPAHGVRRMLRLMPRYRRAWVWGQLLRFLEIPTARPLALLERRYGPLRGVAFLIQEDLAGEHLLAEVSERGLTDARCEEITGLLGLLKRAGISHGDMKATNFVIHRDRVHLIDLDAMRFDAGGSRADVQRFLDNWPTSEAARFRTFFLNAGLL
jgi:tRNA A-37 threonylcarbamoyl transferase component Bud32